ncbi:MAG TPA: ERF family protein [Chloroflexota bacterium]|nr:ERF family protein [Chloroflexota bacterium]
MAEHSDNLEALAAALVRVQRELTPVTADAVGWVGRLETGREYPYATLARVWAAIRTALGDHGLAVVQPCEPGQPGEVRLTTMLLHDSGQWIAGTCSVPVPANGPRGYGSALTYARRYALAAMVGVCVETDDDALAAEAVADIACGASEARDEAGPASASAARRNKHRPARNAVERAGQVWRPSGDGSELGQQAEVELT